MGMWHEITGPVKRFAGASGTVTLPAGAQILSFIAHATSAGSVTFPDGIGGTVTLPVPAGTWAAYDPKHLACAMGAAAGLDTVVFTSTDSYLLEVQSKQGF